MFSFPEGHCERSEQAPGHLLKRMVYTSNTREEQPGFAFIIYKSSIWSKVREGFKQIEHTEFDFFCLLHISKSLDCNKAMIKNLISQVEKSSQL